MIVRYAIFEGRINRGREAEFRKFVEDRLVPLWTAFPGAEQVRVQFESAHDDGAPDYPLVLAIQYPDMETCERALQSDVRAKSRQVTEELVKMFTGRIHHHVFQGNAYDGR